MKLLLKKLGNQRFSLVVHPENTAAILIYLHLGFVIKDWKENYFGDNKNRIILIKEKQS